MYENLLLPYITPPIRVTPRSQTLIDNIFSNIIEDIISGNITTTISDHYVQFVLFKDKIKWKTNIKRLILQETISLLENKYRLYKNQIYKTLLKASKSMHYQKFFEGNKTK